LEGYYFRVNDLLELGDVAGADCDIAAQGRLADELRQPYYRWQTAWFRGARALMDGRIDDAEALAVEAVQLGQEAEDPDALLIFGVQLSYVRREQGRLEELLSAVASFVDMYPALPAWRAALAVCHAELGHADEARQQYELLTAPGLDAIPDDFGRLVALACLAEVGAFLGDTQHAA